MRQKNLMMKISVMTVFCILCASLLLLAGCASKQKTPIGSNTVPDTNSVNKVPIPTENVDTNTNTGTGDTGLLGQKYKGTLLAGSKAPYLDYTDDDYDKAVADGKIILLYFYSEESSACKADQPIIFEAFNEMTNDNIIGFRVNYDDAYTSLSEKKLATDFGVDVSQTRVIVKDGKLLQKSKTTWNSNDYVRQLTQYLT